MSCDTQVAEPWVRTSKQQFRFTGIWDSIRRTKVVSHSYFTYLMRVRWDEAKQQRVLAERDIDFGQLNDLLYTPYLEDQRSELPEQYRIIGFADGQLTTFIVEYRADKVGEYIWVVTAWKSTKQERRSYEQRIY